jgi:PST family polysaccharide transporter
LALNYPIWALGGVHQALLTKRLAFNKRFIPDFLQAMVKGLLSIALAYSGFGAWSLIIGHLSGTAVSVIAVWLLVSWRPDFAFIRSRSLTLLRFGLPMVGLNIIALIVTNTDYILVGRYLGSESLGIYTLAFRVPELTILYFCSVVAEVLFPLFTRIRDDEEALKKGFLQTILYVSLITVPLGLGMILLADPFIRTLFTDKWLDAVPVMRTIAAYALLLSLAFNAGDVYKARGVPNVLTKIALVKAAILIPALYYAVTIPKSILFVGYMQIMVAAIGSAINLVVAARMLHIPLLRILSSFVPALISGLGLIAMVLPSMYLFSSSAPWVQLISGTLLGGLGYILVLVLVDRPLSNSLLQTIRSLAGNK